MAKKTVRDIDVGEKRVLVRVDFNVPLEENGIIADDTRIRACLPTIQYLHSHKCRIILCSHLGRPHGKVDETLRLAPVGRRLSDLLRQPVNALKGVVEPDVRTEVSRMKGGDIVLLENLRFYPGEEQNDPEFARGLASLAEIFVNDAFGASHRSHASVVGIAAYLPCVAGFLMEKEITQLGRLLEGPARPFAAILGGAKVAEKVEILENLLPKTDLVLIGGGMAVTFLVAKWFSVGASSYEPDRIGLARTILKKAGDAGVRIVLPEDLVVRSGQEPADSGHTARIGEIPPQEKIGDIGPRTLERFTQELTACRTVVWNGPVGIIEIPAFSHGTEALARFLAGLDATTVVGGGSTAEAVTRLGLAERMTHVSTGGGATLRFLAGKTLPGIAVIPDRD